MRLPPYAVRRPLQLLGLLLVAVSMVPLALAAVVATAVRPRALLPLRAYAFALMFLALELLGLLAAAALWVASGFGLRLRAAWSLRAHYDVLGVLLAEAVRFARLLFGLRLVTDGTGWSPLSDGVPGSTNAMVVLSRHAGPGDSLLLVHTLLDRDHLRRPRIVLKDLLRWDPLIDVYLTRLPSSFLPPGGDTERLVAELATGMGEEDALLIFPEGGNTSPARRSSAIARLRGKGLLRAADQAERLRHLLPPRPGGVGAALAAAPYADVVFVAHAGLDALSGPLALWRGLPMTGEVRLRWDFVPAAEVPRRPAEQVDWLYREWESMDDWVARHSADYPSGT
ncbi:MAG: phospholipid/glycerol acyltransferase [Frankiales bacterium]|nr:phospholipid/glycerol acyltransferase [Frankiales bacterium]